MAIERDEHGNVIVTGEHIQMYRMRAQIGALRIQASTGMRHSKFNILQIVREEQGFKGNLRSVLKQLEDRYDEMWGPLPAKSEANLGATLAPMDKDADT
jgi:hypothetical protein